VNFSKKKKKKLLSTLFTTEKAGLQVCLVIGMSQTSSQYVLCKLDSSLDTTLNSSTENVKELKAETC
jgi:hypothetical protein